MDRKAAREESGDFGRSVTDAGLDVEDGDTGLALELGGGSDRRA